MKSIKKKWFCRGLAFICAATMFLCPCSAVPMSAYAAEEMEQPVAENAQTRTEDTDQTSDEGLTASSAEEMKSGVREDNSEEESANVQSVEESRTEKQTAEEAGSLQNTDDSADESTAAESNQLPQTDPSIRRIIRPDTTPRRTYEFYVDDILVDSQTIKNNEYLTEPSKPEKSGSVFKGWSVDGGETLLSFGEEYPITDITGENGAEETVQVYPVFEQKYTVTFHGRDGSVLTVRDGNPGASISTTDVKFEVLNGYYVSGWTKDPEGSESGKVGDSITLPEADASSSEYNDGNMDLYPIMKDVCWIFFDDGMGSDSTVRSYTAPFYVKQNETITKPEDPVRDGYEFKGWSTKQDGTENDLYDFNTPVTQSMVLYAVWEPVETKYTVEVLIEELVHGKYVEGNYSPAGEYVPTSQTDGTNKIKAVTGAVINPSDGKEGTTLDKDDVVRWFDNKSGIPYSYVYDFDKMDQDIVVKGDGSTIVHVYFKLHLFTVKFNIVDRSIPYNNYRYGGLLRCDKNENGKLKKVNYSANALLNDTDVFYEINGKKYTIKDDQKGTEYILQARFGERISDIFPDTNTEIVIKDSVTDRSSTYYQDLENMKQDGWITAYNSKLGDYADLLNVPGKYSNMSTAFIRKNYSRTNDSVMSLYSTWTLSSVHKICYSMYENIDNDDFSMDPSVTYENYTSSGSFTPSQKNGYTWVFDTTEKEKYNAPEGKTDEYPNGYPKTDESGDPKVYYNYYYRNRYALEFWSGTTVIKAYDSTDKTSENAKIKHGTPLKKYYFVPERPAGLDDAYQFGGWYTTENCADGTEFNFDSATMPIANLNLYAKWSVPDVKVVYNLNGGTAGDDFKDSVDVTYGEAAERPADPSREGCTFAGWINEETAEPFNFATKLFKDTRLTARWISDKAIYIKYDADPGSNAPEDSGTYVDVSRAVVKGAPTAPEGKYFYGWQYDGNIYGKGDEIAVLSKNAVKNENGTYTITLTAVYGDKAPGTTLVYNANGGTGDPYIVGANNNANVKLLSIDDVGFLRIGYTFTGWNTKPDGSGDSYKAGDTVVVDKEGTGDAPNTLYAQWEEVKYIVTYTDGVDDAEVFKDDVHSDISAGTDTPAFTGGTPTRDGYTFAGWTPKVADKVTADAVYTAVWKENSKEEPTEPVKPTTPTTTYTVTYTDGVNDAEVFKDQVTSNLASGAKTPVFDGTPSRDGYKFTGWTPAVAETVTGNATYTATWEKVSKEEPTTPVAPISPGNPKTPETPATADTTAAPATTDKKDTSKGTMDKTKGNTTPSTITPNKDNGAAQNANAANASTMTASSPGTGDENHLVIYVLGILVSAGVLAAVIVVMRRRRRFNER